MPRIAAAGSQEVQRRPGWQNLKRATAGANAFASSSSVPLLRFAEVKGVSQESELQVESRTLKAELAVCEAEREADLKALLPAKGSDERVAFDRTKAAEAEVKRLGDLNSKLKRGLEQEALVRRRIPTRDLTASSNEGCSLLTVATSNPALAGNGCHQSAGQGGEAGGGGRDQQSEGGGRGG